MAIHIKNREHLIVGITLLGLLVIYHTIYQHFFPFPSDVMGQDYSLFLPMFIDNYFWFAKNGFIPPWFTPTFCGGQVNFADPQSMYYSLPQFLIFADIELINAVYISVLAFAAIGFIGMFLLARRIFRLELPGALICSTLFMFNDFYSYRMIVGHITFQGFMLIPLIAYYLLFNPTHAFKRLTYVTLAGLLLAYCFIAGMAIIIIPSLLSIIVIALIYFIHQTPAARYFALNVFYAGLISLSLSASKLVGSLKLLQIFPRTDYSLPGFAHFSEILSVFYYSLFGSSSDASKFALPIWKNASLPFATHELAFGLTITPIVLLILSIGFVGCAHLTKSMPILFDMRRHKRLWPIELLLCCIWAIPVAIIYYTPTWNAILKTIPFIAETVTPQRWIIIYMFSIILLTGICVNCVNSKIAWALVWFTLILVPFQVAKDSKNDVLFEQIPTSKLSQLFEIAKLNKMSRRIDLNAIIVPDVLAGRNYFTIHGYGLLNCYNPTYGYFLEKMSRSGIQDGPTLSEPYSGNLNIRNPACILFPLENQCALWDNFKTNEFESAILFTSYQPFEFKKSSIQKAADFLTASSLLISISIIGAAIWRTIFRRNDHRSG